MSFLDHELPADALARIVARDGSLYSDDPAVAAEAEAYMGWTDLAEKAAEALPRVESLAAEVKADGLTDVALLGMGGSSLAALVMGAIVPGDGTRLHAFDTTSPITISRALKALDPATTLFLVSSKSGGTIEPNSLYAIFREHADTVLGREAAGRRFVAVTDPGSSLERLAVTDGFRDCVLAPPSVGGRYSALTVFGLVPAALLGIDVGRLVEEARVIEQSIRAGEDRMPLAALMAAGHAEGRDKLTIIAPPGLRPFGLWVEQLVAESLGKSGRGIVPVVELGLPSRRVARPDESFVLLLQPGARDFVPTGDSRHLELTLNDPHELGGWFVLWEYSTALAGAAIGVNPFDQPNVAQAKAATAAVMDGSVEPPEQPTADAADLAQAFSALRPGDYVALLAYLPDDDVLLAPLHEAVFGLAEALDASVCFELGPRYLHSTGQLHKGGPRTGVFVIVTTRDETDLDVPANPFTLRALHAAQADGDMATLIASGRRVLHVELPDASDASIATLAAALAEAGSRRGAQ